MATPSRLITFAKPGYDDRGSLRSVVANCHQEDVRIIVITDGGRILGLGDLGTNGMGISVGKIALYVAGGGFSPDHSLPVVLDCGTNRKDLLESSFYLGTKRPRIQVNARPLIVPVLLHHHRVSAFVNLIW